MDKRNMKNSTLSRRDLMTGICLGILLSAIVFFVMIMFAMTKITCRHPVSELTRPHSPYLMQRDTMDGGFSHGWMPHFLPSEEYWIDTHVHLRNISGKDDLKQLLDEWFSRLDAFRLGKIIAIADQVEMFEVFAEMSQNDPRFAWMFFPKMETASLSQVREAVRCGACAVKLHNAAIMQGNVPRHIWQSEEWQAIFAYAETAGIPLLWHVTQRHSYSPYHGGGVYPYWQQGWAKGVDFTNEDLLQDMLTQVRRFPKLKVIGAHQLHIGIERQAELLRAYDNLYLDSSCGMYLRWADDFIENDRLLLRDFVETWSERIVFGTDADLFPGSIDEYAVQGFLCHARFMLRLGLNDKTLQDVAWRTSQQLFDLKSVSSNRRGNVRP